MKACFPTNVRQNVQMDKRATIIATVAAWIYVAAQVFAVQNRQMEATARKIRIVNLGAAI